MRLLRDVTGSYDQSKDSLQRDLVTTQRAFDQQDAESTDQAKRIADLEAQFEAQRISVSAAGVVVGLPGRPLQSVAHDFTLSGAGTPASPLSVVGSSPPTLFFSTTLAIGALFSLNTSPLLLIACPATMRLVPIEIEISSLVTWGSAGSSTGYTNGNQGFQVRWVGGPVPGIHTPVALGFANGVTTASPLRSVHHPPLNYDTTTASVLNGRGLELFCAANITNNGNGTASARVCIVYRIDSNPLF